MRGIGLANVDYRLHTTTEGDELQRGLEHAGWTLCGAGYGDGCRDVPTLLDRHQPTHVFVQDARDWLPTSNISFRKDVGFERIGILGDCPDIRKVMVVKDAWGWEPEQRGVADAIDADAIATYYAHDVVKRVAPWTERYRLLRIHHSVDADLIRDIGSIRNRRRACVTGNVSNCYPLRTRAVDHADRLGLDVRRHPGYGNRGADTPAYLRYIAGFRVHVATASQWEVAFRKIIESVACGCTPVTNLDPQDVLPEIDGALVRIPIDSSIADIDAALKAADAGWDYAERMEWADKALRYYDYKASGRRFAEAMSSL